jgi:uncharacterized protein YjdB
VSIILSLSSCFLRETSDNTSNSAVVLSQRSITFGEVAETADLTARVFENAIELSASAAEESIKWSTSDPNVAICENGVVTTTGYGVCVVRATYKNSSATCTVQNVSHYPTISISKYELKLDNIGSVDYITATSEKGSDITSSAVWISSNENIATCSDGVITAVGYGSCTITAISNNKTAVCLVTVKNPTAPSVTLSESLLSLNVGDLHTLTVQTDNNAGNTVTWKSSDSTVASCENGTVTAKRNGICVILAITENGNTAACVVNVGSTNKDTYSSEYLNFGFPDLYKQLDYIDKKSGNLFSSAIVISYKIDTLLLDDGRLVVEITLNCVKTYDAEGALGVTPTAVTTSLFRENDAFCDKHLYKVPGVAVGDSFKIKCSGFTVQTDTDGTAREFYMTFASISEI